MELSRNAKIALYGLPIAVGLYLIYRQLSKSKAAKAEPAKETPPQPQTPSKPTQITANDAFPLKKGSRDAGAPYAPSGRVVALQKMINIKGYDENGKKTQLKEDGIFGPHTEVAVYYWIEKNSVDNLNDWNDIFRGVAPYIAAPKEDPMLFNNYDRIGAF